MAVNQKKAKPKESSTQRYLPFSQIKENVIFLKDGSARSVLRCSSINFLLKSQEEQDALVINFQRFVNALDFPVQIMVRSIKFDIESYIKNLSEIAKNQTNSVLKEQTENYINFMEKLVEVAQIMKKEFYIVVPFDEIGNSSVRNNGIIGLFKSFWASINGTNDLSTIKSQQKSLPRMKKGLSTRISTIRTGLENLGIRVTELEKHELAKLLADYFNPNMADSSPLKSHTDNYDLK